MVAHNCHFELAEKSPVKRFLDSLRSLGMTLFIIIVFILNTTHANANSFSLSISPPLLQIQANAPAKIKAPITIQNLSDDSIKLDILFKPFTASQNQNGEPNYVSISNEYSLLFKNTQILDQENPIQNLSLYSQQEKKLYLQIDIPENQKDKDYYFSIQFISKPNIVNDNSNYSQILAGIGMNVLMSLGKEKANAVLQEFSSPVLLGKGPVPFTLKIKNTGEHFIAPQGLIVIKNVFGQIVGKVDLMPTNILKDSTRLIKPVWNESFLLGAYTANLNIAISEQGPIFTKSISFFAMPSKAIIILLASLFFILLIYNRLKKNIS